MTEKKTIWQLIEEYKTRGDGQLDISGLSQPVDELPDELFDLTDLKSLTIRSAIVSSLSKKIVRLRRLASLHMDTALPSLPLHLMELPSLRTLTFCSKTIREIPPEAADWERLQILDLSGCGWLSSIEELPPNLIYLNISNTGLEGLPPAIFTLGFLSQLVASELNLKVLPDGLFDMRHLRRLFLHNTHLNRIPLSFSQLENLTELYLGNNCFQEYPDVISSLSNLETLDLYNNLIREIPDSIRHLQELQAIDLSNNNLLEFPRSLLQLKKIQSVKLSNYEKPYSQSTGNQITLLPEEILQLEHLTNLDVTGCDITNVPKEIAKEGIDAIRNFLLSKNEADSEASLLEAKMVIVGRGSVGKTALTKKLTEPGFRLQVLKSTEGISILKNPYLFSLQNTKDSGFKFNIWDFGGQEKYDATHQLFITNRSVYLFLTEARNESNYLDFYYWLNTINLFSENSPVIVVLSKVDERKKNYPEALFREKFKNIIQFVDVSCAEGYEYTIENLKKAIHEAINVLPQKKQKLPNRWVDIRNDLEQLSKTRDYIDYKEYVGVCHRHQLDETQAGFLSQFLNDLGVIIHHGNDLLLKKTVFINTDWCTDGIYKVLDDKKIAGQHGKFTMADLSQLWCEPRFENKQEELLKLMTEYKLCLRLKDGSGYIVPDLLPPDRPAGFSWDTTDNLRFEFRYDFMPAGILSRFIVKAYSFIKGARFWKYGAILQYDNTEALIEEDQLKSKIMIYLKGENNKGLLEAIRMYIAEVHQDLDRENKLTVHEMVPCRCEICKKGNPYFFKFSTLKKYERNGRPTIICEESTQDVNIRELIEDVQLPGSGRKFSGVRDLQQFIVSIIDDQLEKDITLKEGFYNFWRDQACSAPKNEVEFQPYLSTVIDNYCKVRGINLTREVREANGSVDIFFSYTTPDNEILKLCLEIKKAHHPDIETAISSQLPEYMRSAGTEYGIYLVIWLKNEAFAEPRRFADIPALADAIGKHNPATEKIAVRLINCSKGTAPSKIRTSKTRKSPPAR